eukprot:4718138-Prymnesium_polylepis.3
MNAELFEPPPLIGDDRSRLSTPSAMGLASTGRLMASASAPQLPSVDPFQRGGMVSAGGFWGPPSPKCAELFCRSPTEEGSRARLFYD